MGAPTLKQFEISDFVNSASLESIRASIATNHLQPDVPESALTLPEQFYLRSTLGERRLSGLSGRERVELFGMVFYGSVFIDYPEEVSEFYEEFLWKIRYSDKLCLIAKPDVDKFNRYQKVTVGLLGKTSNCPEHVYFGAQRANFGGQIGLSGLCRVRLAEYQQVALDSSGDIDIAHSRPNTSSRFYPYIIEHARLHSNAITTFDRRDFIIGEQAIAAWIEAHQEWGEQVEHMVYGITHHTPNRHPSFAFVVRQRRRSHGLISGLDEQTRFEQDEDQ